MTTPATTTPVDRLMAAARMTEAELSTLVARLPNTYARNVRECIEALRSAMADVERERVGR